MKKFPDAGSAIAPFIRLRIARALADSVTNLDTRTLIVQRSLRKRTDPGPQQRKTETNLQQALHQTRRRIRKALSPDISHNPRIMMLQKILTLLRVR